MSEKAILLANLGSPDSYETSDVKRYLSEFLMDERVIDIPSFFRTLLVKGIIVPFRAPKSAAKYKTIWTDEGSPLLVISRKVQEKLQQHVPLPVELCMRYANPTPQSALDKLQRAHPNLKEVVLVPLYPHYAMSSYETAVEHVKKAHLEGGYAFQLKVVPPFYQYPAYIDALATSMKPHVTDVDHVLFSYHGVPVRHLRKTDPSQEHCMLQEGCCSVDSNVHQVCYRHQVIQTTEKVAEQLNLPEGKYSFSFQSRLGSDKWLEPFTARQLEEFPKKGIKKLAVVCPAFVSDCLETLEEISEEGREIFMENGGEEFRMIPCLNDNDQWINVLRELTDQKLA